jgi:hypothetical protein
MAQGPTWPSVSDKFYLGTKIFTNINGTSGSSPDVRNPELFRLIFIIVQQQKGLGKER